MMLNFTDLIRARRSTRDFLPTPIPDELFAKVLEDANWAPSWSNTQPYKIAIATGARRDRLSAALTSNFDRANAAQQSGVVGKLRLAITKGGLPDGDFKVHFDYPKDLLPRRRATGFGLYQLLGIERKDMQARDAQMRRNFEFFGAPTAVFIFVHRGLSEFAALDAGAFLQSLMLSAQSHGLATCAQGALATWASPVKAEFDVPPQYALISGCAMGYASDAKINTFNPGRPPVSELLLQPKG